MGERTRIALLITELRPAGAERVVFDLATRLDRERFDVRVYSLVSRADSDGGVDDGAVARALAESGIPVTPVRMHGKLDVFGVRRFVRAMREFRPHVLHAHLFHANLAARMFGRHAGAERIISTIHVVERRPLKMRRLLERLGAGRDDETVCVSQAVARYARERLGVRAPRVIPNGIDLARFADLPDQTTARAALGIGAGPVVGVVGRLTFQKGVDVLLRAVSNLDADVSVVIAGDGEDEEMLRSFAQHLRIESRTHFVGFQEDVGRVLAALDVFCMPSRWEGFGLALVEALAAGLPVVATGVDSIPEVLGDAGLLVSPDDSDALAHALGRVLRDVQTADGLRARARAQAARFTIEPMIASYEALYDEVWPIR